MNKEILVKTVADSIEGATKKDIKIVVDTVFETITSSLVNGDKVSIAGFGSFEIVERAAREGKNPRTGEPLQIPASKAPKFKASKNLKDAVNA